MRSGPSLSPAPPRHLSQRIQRTDDARGWQRIEAQGQNEDGPGGVVRGGMARGRKRRQVRVAGLDGRIEGSELEAEYGLIESLHHARLAAREGAAKGYRATSAGAAMKAHSLRSAVPAVVAA